MTMKKKMVVPIEKFDHPRIESWSVTFVQYLMASTMDKSIRLDWKNWTCWKWAALVGEKITGVNAYSPHYDSGTSAMKCVALIAGLGRENLEEVIRATYYEIPLNNAQRGDLVLVDIEGLARIMPDEDARNAMSVGVGVADPPYYWCVTPNGVTRGDMSNIKAAFLVGKLEEDTQVVESK